MHRHVSTFLLVYLSNKAEQMWANLVLLCWKRADRCIQGTVLFVRVNLLLPFHWKNGSTEIPFMRHIWSSSEGMDKHDQWRGREHSLSLCRYYLVSKLWLVIRLSFWPCPFTVHLLPWVQRDMCQINLESTPIGSTGVTAFIGHPPNTQYSTRRAIASSIPLSKLTNSDSLL